MCIIENKRYKVKFKKSPLIFFMPGMWVDLYYEAGLADEIEFVEEFKNE